MTKGDNSTVQILSNNLFPVVGVGASAGGLETFKELVKAIPEDSGMAYIFIQHLSPNYESLLSEILQKLTNIPVIEITDHIKVLPNHIYVIPSNKSLVANDGVLLLAQREKGEKLNTIDIFFNSLAEIHQEHAIGVVLSGTGNDGTIGLKTIKGLGGITIVQDAKSAAYYGMPQSAIDAEVVDFILPPGEIPNHLQELIHASKIIPSLVNFSEELKDDESFRQILNLIRAKRGLDFTYYKQTTIRRRILRRKAINKVDTLKEYQNYLSENKSELEALFNDILIPVTAFFRDPATFDTVCEKVFPELFKNKTTNEPIRIWIAGCSTGEEAYSMAICLHEYFGDEINEKKIQIFATDISETVIAKARSGIYQKRDMTGVSETRLKDFFTKTDGSYQVNKMIRQICVFACQNFLKDPPFAKMDFISCRNVMIYLEPYLQKKALNTFHYALNPGGFLLLGKSETIGQASEQFLSFNQANKIYTRKELAGKYMLVATERAEASLKRKDNDLTTKDAKKDDFQKAADDALLSKYGPVGVIVNDQWDIIQFRGITSAYLEAAPGKASHNILKMAREGLAFELRTALHKARTGMEVIRKEGIALDKGKRRATIEVIPLRNTIELYYLVLFEETISQEDPIRKKTGKKISDTEKATKNFELLRIEQLESQLSQALEDMRTITEDQEAANEELQSANEELLSGSEELQSLNEELETTKEEIQSTNEELTILNQELIERNDQLIHSRKYAEAIVTTIHEPLVILTKDFRIKSANNAFYETFKLTEQQIEGKLFFELEDGKWNKHTLKEKLQKILPEGSYLEGFEIELKNSAGEELIVELNAGQIINENSNEQLILLAIQDITSQKIFSQELELQVRQRTQELKEVNSQLQQSNENLEQFASIASHDLQEPLRKIRTFTELLKTRHTESLPVQGIELVNKIRISAERMSQLIKEVLQYSKVAHNEKHFSITDLDFILKSVINDLDLLIADTDALIIYDTNLPKVEAIPLQMNQLFYNLLTNALKFRNKNVRTTIEISFTTLSDEEIKNNPALKEELSYIEIKFADNGIGFEQQFGEQIFQIFERLHSLEDYDGTGVGLALCKKIIEIHNGQIYAHAKENEGASFYVVLPLTQ